MLPKPINVSLIQFDCPNSKDEAVLQLLEFVKSTGPDSDLILIAETPYTPYTTVSDFTPAAETIPGDYSQALCQLAKAFNTYICSGIVELDGDRIYNSAILISPNGQIIHKHRKVSLADCDLSGGYTAGNHIEIVETELGRIGILICLDTSSQKNIFELAALKPDLILVPAYGLAKSDYSQELVIDCMIDECIDEWRQRMQMMAKYCKSYVLRTDHCGMEEQQVRIGHAIAVSPGGYVISEATMKPCSLKVLLDPSSSFQKSW